MLKLITQMEQRQIRSLHILKHHQSLVLKRHRQLNNQVLSQSLCNLHKKKAEQFMWRVMEQQMFIGMTSTVCLAIPTKQMSSL